MAEESKDQRTEKPTQKRLRKAYEDGSVPRSADAAQAISLGAFLVWAGIAGAGFFAAMLTMVRNAVRLTGSIGPNFNPVAEGVEFLFSAFKLLAPLLLILLVMGVAGSLAQTGYHPRGKIPFEPHRINPFTGIQGFFNVDKLLQAFKALLRTGLFGGIAAAVVLPEWRHVSGLALLKPSALFEQSMGIVWRVMVRILVVSLVFAAADYLITRRRWTRNLYMTKQQVKDEMKENENPEIRGRIKGKQREVARRRMMTAVRTATVVVTNPTHVAVALFYKPETMAVPLVVAKGKGLVALRIREEAKKHNVPIVEDPPLARTLEKLCPLGAPIPDLLFRAVAEVLAYVFRRRQGPYHIHTEVETETEVKS